MSTPDEMDAGRLAERIETVTHAMRAHGGGIELVTVERGGAVRVRFTGLCAGCQLRPLTFAETIEPSLLDVPGVTRVYADGARLSEEALARLRYYHGESALPRLGGDSTAPSITGGAA